MSTKIFCDIADIKIIQKFSKKKSGFSGTVNLKLPILYDDKIDNCKYTINENSININDIYLEIENDNFISCLEKYYYLTKK